MLTMFKKIKRQNVQFWKESVNNEEFQKQKCKTTINQFNYKLHITEEKSSELEDGP